MNLGDRVLSSPLGAEPVRDRLEIGLEDRLQHQLQRSLNDPIRNSRDAELSQLSRPAGLGNLAFPHRQRPKRTILQTGPQIVQKPGHPDDLLNIGGRQAVHARSIRAVVARDPLERHQQRRRVTHEIEQVIEPAAGIGRSPTVKLGLHLRYPTIWPHNGFRRCTDIHRRVFRHYSIPSFSQPLPPFPMCTGFPRLGVLRRLRPAPTRSADDEPSPTTRVGYTATRQDQGGSRVHCDSLDEGGAQLYPCGLATTTPQHVTVASRTATHMTARKFPAPIHRHGCAPRPAHIRQV